MIDFSEGHEFKVGDRLVWLGKFNASMYTTGATYEIKSQHAAGALDSELVFGVTDDEQTEGSHTWPADALAEHFGNAGTPFMIDGPGLYLGESGAVHDVEFHGDDNRHWPYKTAAHTIGESRFWKADGSPYIGNGRGDRLVARPALAVPTVGDWVKNADGAIGIVYHDDGDEDGNLHVGFVSDGDGAFYSASELIIVPPGTVEADNDNDDALDEIDVLQDAVYSMQERIDTLREALTP